jgi:hypothetical protein
MEAISKRIHVEEGIKSLAKDLEKNEARNDTVLAKASSTLNDRRKTEVSTRGGGIEYLHRSPASRRYDEKGTKCLEL